MRSQIYLLVVLIAAAVLTSCNAYAAGPRRVVKRPTYYAPAVRSAPPALAATAPLPVEPPKRLVHVRLQTLPLVEWMTQQDTLASLRGDVDLIVSDRVSFGPSVIYQRRSVIDTVALAAGQSVALDTDRLELGLVGNIFVHGTTSTGGFLFRPHVYYVIPSGVRDTETGITPGVAKNGLRTGLEFLFQKVLDVGFSFEVGGGFTYHAIPWEVAHAGVGAGQSRVAPENLFVPTLTVGVGWAF